MIVGKRIKFFRNLRGMTQMEFGLAIGFSENTADVRIGQYETGGRIPRQGLTNILASHLSVAPQAISPVDLESGVGLAHMLFILEDMYGVQVTQINGEFSLSVTGVRDKSNPIPTLLAEWYRMHQAYITQHISKQTYDQWRYTYQGATEPLQDSPEGVHPQTVGAKIRVLRKQRGLTQKELANRSGVSEVSIHKYEADDRHPKIEQVCKLAQAMGVEVQHILPIS